jgi:hypothetical protein
MSYKWTTYMMAQLDTLPIDQRGTRHAQIKEALEEGYLCGVVEMLFDELKEARSVGDDLAVMLEEKASQLEEAYAEIKFTREQFTSYQKQQEAFTQAGLKATAESSALMVAQASQLSAALQNQLCAAEELKVQLAKVTQQRNDRAAEASAAYMKIGELSLELEASGRLYEAKISAKPPACETCVVPPSPPPSRYYRAPEMSSASALALSIRSPSPPPRIQRSCSLVCDSPSSLYD